MILSLALLGLIPAQAIALFGHRTAHVTQCLAHLKSDAPVNVASTLERISGDDRRLLALRSYLKNRSSLGERWSWTADAIARYGTSAEHRAASEELTRITRQFESANPGYTLYVNSEVRSLDAQIEKWNSNQSVGAAAKAIAGAAMRQAPGDGCESADSRKTFAEFLAAFQPPRIANLAAPGLSKHGQARAFDFQIKRGGLIVAGTDSASIKGWDRSGWTEKLQQAVTTASSRFSGPLKVPYEPWHYEYRP